MQFGQSETKIRVRKTGFLTVKNVCSFSEGYTQVGEKKKYKAHISKYVPCIFSFLRPILCLPRSQVKQYRQKRIRNRDSFFILGC